MTAANCLEYLNAAFKYDLKALKSGGMEEFFSNRNQLQKQAKEGKQLDGIPQDILESMGLLSLDSAVSKWWEITSTKMQLLFLLLKSEDQIETDDLLSIFSLLGARSKIYHFLNSACILII